MDTTFYLDLFGQVAGNIDKAVLARKQLDVATGLYFDSVFLKLYKTSWASPSPDPLTAKTRIFFSIWISDPDLAEQRLLYNIHALKLRHLQGYSIASRKFAGRFRDRFAPLAEQWPNVRVDYGPLTLMQGWIPLNEEKLQRDITELANHFIALEPLIEQTLAEFKSGKG